MAPTEGRVSKAERRWDCRGGTPGLQADSQPKSVDGPFDTESAFIIWTD